MLVELLLFEGLGLLVENDWYKLLLRFLFSLNLLNLEGILEFNS